MGIKVVINSKRMAVRIEEATKKALPLLTEEIMNDCNQYAKEDTGALIASSLIHSRPEEGLIIWQTPYARRQYWEIRTAYTDRNPNATWKWAMVAKEHHLDKWLKQAERLVKMGL